MPISVFHGDDQAKSYQALKTHLDQLNKLNQQIVTLEGKTLDLATLSASLNQNDFFDTPKVIVITNFFARAKSKARDQMLVTIKDSPATIILWENKNLTSSMLKSLGKIDNFYFPHLQLIWQLLEQLSPNYDRPAAFIDLYEQTLTQNDELYLLAMIIWQVQQLVDTLENNFHGAPFKRQSLQLQAQNFQASELKTLHHQLIDLDWRTKTGQLRLPLAQELLFMLLSPEFAQAGLAT